MPKLSGMLGRGGGKMRNLDYHSVVERIAKFIREKVGGEAGGVEGVVVGISGGE